MTCPACGQEEDQDKKGVLAGRPLVIHHECATGHRWHMPLVICATMRPTPCDCEPSA